MEKQGGMAFGFRKTVTADLILLDFITVNNIH
jgi:hypothetical protein